MTKRRKRAAAFVRISNETTSDLESLASQEQEIRKYCALNGYELLEEHIFIEQKSAKFRTYKEREVFTRLLDCCDRRELDVVVVTEFSRLARKSEEFPILMGVIRSFKVDVESTTETYNDKSAQGRLMLAITAYQNDVETEKTKYRTTRGKMHRLNNGNLNGGGIPTYGYQFIDTEKETSARYIIKQEEAEIVILIYRKSDSGLSVRRIAIFLTEQNIPTPKGKPVWSNQTVDRILRNPAYIGRCIQMKWQYNEDHKRVPRPVEDHVELPEGIIPPILVTQDGLPNYELFERVQDRLALNKTESTRSNKHDELGLLRAKKCYCKICGWAMKVKYPRKAYGRQKVPHTPEYYCRIKNGGEGIINNHTTSISMSILDKAAWEYALTYLRNPDLVREHIAKIREQIKDYDDGSIIEENLAAISKKIRNLNIMGRDASDDEILEDIMAQIKKLEQEKWKLERYKDEQEEEAEITAKINAALDRFEGWTKKTIDRFDDPEADLTYDEKRGAILALGLKATIGAKDSKERIKFTIAPPKIMELMPLIS